jgi:hypothetical protein
MSGFSETAAKTRPIMQVSSVVIGLAGLLLLLAGFGTLYTAFIAQIRTFGVELAPVFILVGGYFSWIPYRVIRRYSRAAVVHFWIGAVAVSFGLVFIVWLLAYVFLFSA